MPPETKETPAVAAETVEALKKRLISELIVREGPYVNHPS